MCIRDSSQASALYNVVKAKTSVPGTYFCAMNFDDGYIGFQEQSNGKKVIIFSKMCIRDSPDTALLGRTLFDKYNRSLVIAGLALLVASIGVVVLSRRPSGKR